MTWEQGQALAGGGRESAHVGQHGKEENGPGLRRTVKKLFNQKKFKKS
jgi:hypothetical protein